LLVRTSRLCSKSRARCTLVEIYDPASSIANASNASGSTIKHEQAFALTFDFLSTFGLQGQCHSANSISNPIDCKIREQIKGNKHCICKKEENDPDTVVYFIFIEKFYFGVGRKWLTSGEQQYFCLGSRFSKAQND